MPKEWKLSLQSPPKEYQKILLYKYRLCKEKNIYNWNHLFEILVLC